MHAMDREMRFPSPYQFNRQSGCLICSVGPTFFRGSSSCSLPWAGRSFLLTDILIVSYCHNRDIFKVELSPSTDIHPSMVGRSIQYIDR